MNEEESKRLLQHIKTVKFCILIITILAVVAFAYNVFRVYDYYLGDQPEFPANKAFYQKVREAIRTGDDATVVALCQEELKEEPNNTGALTCLGEAYFRLGKWQDCIDTMNRLLAISPTREERYLPVIKKAQEKLKAAQTPEQ